ncbi:MAG: hypothetical protein Q4G27_06740 [Flavobacteriaceae bacterium]|nr:hypothetical protein [Flavobacteriaceae bacterium]
MKTIFPILALLIIIAVSCTQSGEQQARMPKQYTSEQLRSNIHIFFSDFNKDESQILIGSNQTGIYNAYMLNLADTTMQQLTHSTKEAYLSHSFIPGTSKYILEFDEGGNENYRLYLTSVGDTTLKDLTPWPGSSNSVAGWSLDKKTLYFGSNKRDARYFDLWQMDTATWEPTMIYQSDLGYMVAGLSKTARYVALLEPITSNKNNLYLFDIPNKKLTRISNDNEALWMPTGFEKNHHIIFV